MTVDFPEPGDPLIHKIPPSRTHVFHSYVSRSQEQVPFAATFFFSTPLLANRKGCNISDIFVRMSFYEAAFLVTDLSVLRCGLVLKWYIC